MQLTLESALANLESRGFVNKKQNIRLLKRANYDPEIVANFLSAKRDLHSQQTASNSEESKIIDDSSVQLAPGNTLRVKCRIAKQAHPELFAKFLEAKKALHACTVSNSDEDDVPKRGPLTKQERIARRQQRLQLKAAKKDAKEEEEKSSETVVNQKEEIEDDAPKRFKLTKEERLARKLQRIQLRAAKMAAKDNKEVDLVELKEEEEEKTDITEPTSSVVEDQDFPKRNKLTKEERLARKEARLKMKLIKLTSQPFNNSTNEEETKKCPLTKEERLARKEARLKMKEERLNLRAQRLNQREAKVGMKIPPRAKTVYIDGSSISKTKEEIIEMAKKMIETNSHIEKCIILFEGEATSLVDDKLVVASSFPLFGTIQEAVKCLTQNVQDKKTLAVVSGNKNWIVDLRKEMFHAFAL